MTTSAPPFAGLPNTHLPGRLAALASLVQIARDRSGPAGFSPELLAEAEVLLERAGERLRLSAAHTVVTLAGGTGSGKSSLFNALAGATFSPPAVTRPATRSAHACVWGMQGAAPLLDWLGIERRYRYARASALDAGEAALSGLLLLDLPDHDSVAAGAAAAVDRLVSQADLMVWVVDPQKYADAAVHNRFLAPLARHATVTAVALNQCDLLTPQQAKDCEEDLRRLLDSEGYSEAHVLLVSAATGAGLERPAPAPGRGGLRPADRDRPDRGRHRQHHRQVRRLRHRSRRGRPPRSGRQPDGAADQAVTAAPFAPPGRSGPPGLLGLPGRPEPRPPRWRPPQRSQPPRMPSTATWRRPPRPPPGRRGSSARTPRSPPRSQSRQTASAIESVPAGPALNLADALARAAGLAAVTDALEDVREIHAARYLSWPFGRARRTAPRP